MKTSRKLALSLSATLAAGLGLYALYQNKEAQRQKALLSYVKEELVDEEIKASWLMDEPVYDNVFEGGLVIEKDDQLESIEFEVDDDTLEITEIRRKLL
ncbi:hypothetical protein OZX68_01710 [Streptococcaceae bacterium ESL0729]|nr:hypothetical protein OZX68_01710 [Streptococcaceae bacterium ESL0729]